MMVKCRDYAAGMDLDSLSLEGGGSLEFCVSDPAGASDWLEFHVGSPCAAVLFPHITQAAARRGLQIVTYSRGGYGGSTRSPGRTVAEEARNTAALADHLSIATFHVVGWSGGGPSALACAALLPDRVRSCLVLAGSSPKDEVGPGWFGWHDSEYAEELRTSAVGSLETYRQEYEDAAATMQGESFEDPTLPEVDRETLARRPELADAIADSFRRAFAKGVDGWMDDAVASARPWGFDVSDIRVPIAIRHGELDTYVRVDHGRWLAAKARANILPDHGHISIVDPFEPALDALLKTS
jgi:pimeloyl-ACP methyl ester carboxylesterase